MIPTKSLDLFAGVAVTEFARALEWYQRLLGFAPAFFPHDTEAVWELAAHRFLYIVEQPEHAGHSRQTLFIENLDEIVAEIGQRGLHPTKREQFPGNVNKISYRDADGNEVGFAGVPLQQTISQIDPAST